MLWPVQILGVGAASGLPFKAVREGQIHEASDAVPLAIPLDQGLYLVRGERVDSLAAWAIELATADPGAASPVPPGGVPSVVAFRLTADPATGTIVGQVQQWIAVDRQCVLHSRVPTAGASINVLIWRAGDCPPEYGGIPVDRSLRSPRR